MESAALRHTKSMEIYGPPIFIVSTVSRHRPPCGGMGRRGCCAGSVWRTASTHRPFNPRTQEVCTAAPVHHHQQISVGPHASHSYHRWSRVVSVCSVPSASVLCALALGCCLCVPPGGGRLRTRRPASVNPQVRPQRSNSVPIPPIGPLLTRACVPVSVRRCD